MSVYRIADLNIKIDNMHEYIDKICKGYLSDDQNHFDFIAKANVNDFEKDRAVVPQASDSYLESLSVYRCISNNIIDYNGFVLHASVIVKDGFAYAFAAKSGTGKTTHSRLWLKVFPDAEIINGDKPLIRCIDGVFYAYGTPWCGKENYNKNKKAQLKGICFIERDENNSIVGISKAEAVKRIYTQLLIPNDAGKAAKTLELLSEFIDTVPAYLLKCNISEEAAFVAYKELSK